jgi:hypothetical protein
MIDERMELREPDREGVIELIPIVSYSLLADFCQSQFQFHFIFLAVVG